MSCDRKTRDPGMDAGKSTRHSSARAPTPHCSAILIKRPGDGPRLRWQIETLAAGAIESLHARVALGTKVQVKHQIFPGNL